MRILSHIFLLSIVLAGSTATPRSAYAQPVSAQEIFNVANAFLQDDNYAQALSTYREAEASGYISGALWLNMGIAAARMDSLGLATVYLSRAQVFPEVTVAAEEALQFAALELGRRGARLPELGWMKVLQLLHFEIAYRFWLTVGLLLLNLGVILFVLHWFREPMRELNRWGGISSIAVGLLLITVSLIMDIRSENYLRGTQIVRETQIMASPDPDSQIVQTGFEGFQYIVNTKESTAEPAWYAVRMSNGARGWVERHAILTH